MHAATQPAYLRRRRITGFLFFLPALLYLALFLLVPIVTAAWISLTHYNLLAAPRFVGLRNYFYIFNDPSFWGSLWVTAKYLFYRIVILFIISFAMALVINRRVALYGAFQTVYFLPYVFPLAVTAVMWKLFYRPFGLVEQITNLFGIAPQNFLASENTALGAITATTIWSASGYYAVIVLAGLQTISGDVIEASVIDGAGMARRFISIVLPQLRPTMFYMIVISIINTIQGYPPFLIMTDGGPGSATLVIGLVIYQKGFVSLEMGTASAMTVVLVFIILIVTLAQRKLLKTDEEQE